MLRLSGCARPVNLLYLAIGRNIPGPNKVGHLPRPILLAQSQASRSPRTRDMFRSRPRGFADVPWEYLWVRERK